MSEPALVRVATRGSELALWQSRAIAEAIATASPGARADLRVIRTTGDRILDVPLAKIGDKGLFTKELDEALLDGSADLAVHSLKDVPTRLPEGLTLAAVTLREDPRDVLLRPAGQRGGIDTLTPGARVGTSSLRRSAQLRAHRPELELLDLRGNLNTRLARLDAGEYDAIVLAAAGVLRLGWKDRICDFLEPAWCLPAVGQGALGVVVRSDDARTALLVRPIADRDTTIATRAERSFLRALEGGCQIPIGALGRVESGRLTLDGLVASLDGSIVLRDVVTGSPDGAESLGETLASRLRARGAGEILAALRETTGGSVRPAPAP